MLRINHARVFACAAGYLLAASIVTGGAGEAFAKSRLKSPISVSEDSPLEIGARPPVRFFTISAVLAKHDRHAVSSVVKLASADTSLQSSPISDSDTPRPQMPATSEEPFGLFTFRAPEGLLWTKWRTIQANMEHEALAVSRCKSDDDCTPGARKFIAVVEAAAQGATRAKIEIVNDSINRSVRYVSDLQQHGVVDRWSSPLETLAAGQGDCEDYAIAKYGVLRAAGFAETDVRVLLVRDLAVRQDHAVLAVRLEGRWVILDNRRSALLETRDLPHFMPLFAINQAGVSLFAAPYASLVHHESETDLLPATNSDAVAGGGQTLQLLL